MNTKDLIYVVIILALLGIVGFFLTQYVTNETTVDKIETGEVMMPVEPDGGIGDGAGPLSEEGRGGETELGTSVEGNKIMAYHFGTGENELLLIGGVHGGYSWNTSLLAYELVDYFDANPNNVPESVTITIIPSLNPDGLKKTIGTYGRFSSTDAVLLGETKRIAGRFNADGVDLNRNFDCNWSPTSQWRSQEVSGGSEVFSEPESQALRNYIMQYPPSSVVVWFSAEGKVYPSACEGSPSTESKSLANSFAAAAEYQYESEFDAYSITGDMVNWLAKMQIPAISVLLTNHSDTEFEKNLAGVEAILETYND